MDITLLKNKMVLVNLTFDVLMTSHRMKVPTKFSTRISILFYFVDIASLLTAHVAEQRLTNSIATLVEVMHICLFCQNSNLLKLLYRLKS